MGEVCAYVCAYVRTCMRHYLRTCVRAHMRTRVPEYSSVCVCERACVRVCVRECVRACVSVLTGGDHVCVYMCMSVFKCVSACAR